jgi:hypothetical protein
VPQIPALMYRFDYTRKLQELIGLFCRWIKSRGHVDLEDSLDIAVNDSTTYYWSVLGCNELRR